MFLGNLEKVYILDKSEANEAKFGQYPAMGAVYDIASRTATTMGVTTNVFCASGMHLPNGSFATFGGNGAVGPGGNIGDVTPPDNTKSEYGFSKEITNDVGDVQILSDPDHQDESLHRGLKARQITMIAIGGAVGKSNIPYRPRRATVLTLPQVLA